MPKCTLFLCTKMFQGNCPNPVNLIAELISLVCSFFFFFFGGGRFSYHADVIRRDLLKQHWRYLCQTTSWIISPNFNGSCDGRVVKAFDSKSNGIFPRRFESYSQRLLVSKFHSARKSPSCVHCRGIEPRSPAWQARILPLNQQCLR